MSYLNVEIKASCSHPDKIREYLKNAGARFEGTDMQTDTYFNVSHGRLKLREGNIENNLIGYQRSNQQGPKQSHFTLVKIPDPVAFKQVMENAIGVKVVVRKKREIYYVGNVKFHIDEVDGLGSFMEIEAGNILAPKTKEELEEQCEFYKKELGVKETDLISVSYSDLLL